MISSESLQSAISVRMLDTFGPEYKKAPNVDVVRVMQARKNRPYNTTLKEAARMLNAQMYLVHKYCSQEEKTSLYTHLTSYAKELHAQAKYAPSPVIIAELQQEVKEVVERNQLARRLRCVCKQPLSSPSNTQTGVLSFEMWALVESTNYKTIERKLRQWVGASENVQICALQQEFARTILLEPAQKEAFYTAVHACSAAWAGTYLE
jgi:hypothetical protein